MRWKPVLLLACLFTLITPAGGQRPNAFFSLSTNKTYLPGEKIGLRVYANNVDALEFRVYKVNDPALFFERLDNPTISAAPLPRNKSTIPLSSSAFTTGNTDSGSISVTSSATSFLRAPAPRCEKSARKRPRRRPDLPPMFLRKRQSSIVLN